MLYLYIKAGLAQNPVGFDFWEYEEETEVLTIEHIGFGILIKYSTMNCTYLFQVSFYLGQDW